MRTLAKVLLPVVTIGALAALLVFDVAPVDVFFDQREQVDAAKQELAQLDAELAELEARAEELRDPDAVEMMARGEFLLTRPGDELYVVRPPLQGQLEFPAGWPFPGVAHLVNGG